MPGLLLQDGELAVLDNLDEGVVHYVAVLVEGHVAEDRRNILDVAETLLDRLALAGALRADRLVDDLHAGVGLARRTGRALPELRLVVLQELDVLLVG